MNSSTVPYWDSLIPSAKAVFTDQGKLYALPFSAYTMGLVVNKVLFQQAGLDPTKPPPTTWQEVAADAKKIAALGNGIAGYSDYSAATSAAGTSPPSCIRGAGRWSATTASWPRSCRR